MDPENTIGTELPGQDLPEETPIPRGGDRPEEHLPERQEDAQDITPEGPEPQGIEEPTEAWEAAHPEHDDAGLYEDSPQEQAYEEQRFDQNEGFGDDALSPEQAQELEEYLSNLSPEEQEAVINELMESQQDELPDGGA